MPVTLYHDIPASLAAYDSILKDSLLERLKALDARASRKGLGALDADRSRLIRIGMEVSPDGAVTKNGYGLFNLSWQIPRHPEWPALIEEELKAIRERIREAHGKRIRFLIWAGMGGSAEDKHTYSAAKLLQRGPRVYVLDSTDPTKLKCILADLEKRSEAGLTDALKSTLVVGMAMGMTSYEPVVNLEKLAALYDKLHIDSKPNFLYMTLPGSLLDQFASKRGYTRIELQLDGQNSTAGRHSAPLTRGSLYPLGLAGADLKAWMEASVLSEADIDEAWKLAAFLYAHAAAGRGKITWILPKEWAGAALWTKQDFEESLGKSEQFGLKIVIGEKLKLSNYKAPKDPRQDRVFVAVQVKGLTFPETSKFALLRRAGYPVASLTLPSGTLLSHYMQTMHYAVFGVAYLSDMNFVTQPNVELYKAVTNRLTVAARKAGGLERTREWRHLSESPQQAEWRGRVTLYFNCMPEAENGPAAAPEIYGRILNGLLARHEIEYAELTFFGDTRCSPEGRAVTRSLNRAAERLFRSKLNMPVDVYEGPAMNHSYHEMIIGHGRCFSTILISEASEQIGSIEYTADYHRAQFLATLTALAERERPVVAISLKNLESATLTALEEFFRQAAKHVNL